MNKKILVVDDSPFMLTVTGNMLKGLGYDVVTVDNGAEACQIVQADRFDMIITDMNMPHMDGLQFTQMVRTYPGCRFLPILMLSGEGNEDKVAEAKKLGVSTFLMKPLNKERLKSILNIVLSKRKSPRVPLRTEIYFGDDNMLSGYTLNFSDGGLFLETREILPIGEELEIRFHQPSNGEPTRCRVRVAWTNSLMTPTVADHPPGMGLEVVSGIGEHEMRTFIKMSTNDN